MPVFLAPWFLVVSAFAVIPVALHLLHRRRPTPVPFSTLMFLREAVAKSRRSRHITNLLTLLMRVLIILLLACSFARPKLRFANWLPEGRRTVVIVLDGSASMMCRDRDETCFSRAVAWAENLVDSLDEEDQVGLLIAGRPDPRVIFPPISDHETVVRALSELQPGMGGVDLVAGLARLGDLLSEGRSGYDTEIHLFSDFQESGCGLVELTRMASEFAGREFLFFFNHLGPPIVANAGIPKVSFHPPGILGSGNFLTRIDVITSADYSGANALNLSVGGEDCSQVGLTLLPDQTVRERLVGRPPDSLETVTGEIRLNPDALSTDNVYRFSLSRLSGIPVLLVDGSAKGDSGTRETFFLHNAIQPGGGTRTIFLPRRVDWPTFLSGEIDEYSVVYLCNPPVLDEAVATKVRTFLMGGGIVFLLPGQHNTLKAGLGNMPGLEDIRVEKEVLSQEEAIALVASQRSGDLEKRILGIITAPSSVTIRRRLMFSELSSEAAGVFYFPDGYPFLLEMPVGRGRLWVSAVSANRDWSEWPLTPFFVVLHQELIRSCAREKLPELITSVGGALPIDWPGSETELDFELTTPSGRNRSVTLTRNTPDKPFVFDAFQEAGFYSFAHEGEELVIAVNSPGEEAELSYLSEEALAGALGTVRLYQSESWQEQRQNLVDLHHGRPFWPVLLCIAFAIVIAEELFANIRSRTTGLPDILTQFMRKVGQRS